MRLDTTMIFSDKICLFVDGEESLSSATKMKGESPTLSSSMKDFKGILIACTILLLFSQTWYHALFRVHLAQSSWIEILITFHLLEFFYTGLFITCHDAMHGAISPRFPRVNNLLGHICISIFAWFDYDRMHKKHWQHHKHTGIVNEDPDYHNGKSIGFLAWYGHFLWEYITLKQITKMTIWVTILMLIFSVPLNNILVYMLVCGLTSSLRLFYFGTYLPHRPTMIDGKFEETMPWEKSYSSNASRWISFLTCYHFDYHWEHHRWPYVPWWDLWKCKEMRRKMH